MMRAVRTTRSALLALLASAALTGANAAAAPPLDSVAAHARSHDLVYDALGDSYASGYGVPPYTACGRSGSAYAVLIDGRQRLRLDDFVACAGATTVSLVAGGQLRALDADTDVVTVTIGGNDIGWSSAVTACLRGTDAQCAGAIDLVGARVAGQLPSLLDTVYAEIGAAAPNAHVVVTGYPHLFSPEYGAFLGASPAEQTALNAGADRLDAVIAAASTRAGFQYVDVRERFDGHGANSAYPWILGPFDPGAFHPNAEGYDAYAAAVTAALGRVHLR